MPLSEIDDTEETSARVLRSSDPVASSSGLEDIPDLVLHIISKCHKSPDAQLISLVPIKYLIILLVYRVTMIYPMMTLIWMEMRERKEMPKKMLMGMQLPRSRSLSISALQIEKRDMWLSGKQ